MLGVGSLVAAAQARRPAAPPISTAPAVVGMPEPGERTDDGGGPTPTAATGPAAPTAAASPTTPAAATSPTAVPATRPAAARTGPASTPRPTASSGVRRTTPSRTPTARPGSSAGPTTSAAPAFACAYDWVFNANWDQGFVATITFVNRSDRSLTDWSGAFGMSRAATITQNWAAMSLTQVGDRVVVGPPAYSRTLAPGASITFSFQASVTTKVTRLGGHSLMGVACSHV